MRHIHIKFFNTAWCVFVIVAILVLSGGMSTDAAVDENTVAVWLFEEGSGKTVRDASGNGHSGKITGSLKWVKQNLEQG